MEIIVCIKWVPETSESDVTIAEGGKDIEKTDLVYSMNEWDKYAVEEALLIKERLGGKVTVVSVGPEAANEILRLALAMGADEAVHLWDDLFSGSDSYAIAGILAHWISRKKFDLILAGALAEDDGCAQVGGLLASLLKIPYATLVYQLEVQEGKARARRELEGGLSENLEMELPALLTIQTGINEPRYVSMRGIRKVAGVEIAMRGLGEIGLNREDVGLSGSRVLLEELSIPLAEKQVVLLEGPAEAAAAKLAEILKEKGGII
jgi:electron transfer flavoprotein beta subunit